MNNVPPGMKLYFKQCDGTIIEIGNVEHAEHVEHESRGRRTRAALWDEWFSRLTSSGGALTDGLAERTVAQFTRAGCLIEGEYRVVQ